MMPIAKLENEFIRFSLEPENNTWSLQDLRSGVVWGNAISGLSWVHRLERDERQPLFLKQVESKPDALRAGFVNADGKEQEIDLVFRLEGPALRVYLVSGGPALPAVEVFSTGLDASADEGGEALLPVRMGLLIPAAGAQGLDMRLGTYEYEGMHMALAGLFKSGAALAVTWQDPYTAVRIRNAEASTPTLQLAVELSKTARSFELNCLGAGDLTTLADFYRQRAADLGYRVTWTDKRVDRPQADRLFGASNFKLWTALARRVDENLVEQSVKVHWTFDEAAHIAEHLRHDLKLGEVLFHLGGWTTYGYDCRHPDIMPANPECGGDAGLADCARRVQSCGYLFCLHDNVQDMYRDAPSWDEKWVQKNPDVSLTQGGVWLGGRAYYTCAKEALKLVQRPQNLPEVKRVANPDVYFIDTTYAVGPQECFDPRHPLTRQDDIRWKQALSDYARQVFGLFGSECGREWAVPHADFFEGLASVSGKYFHMLDPDKLGGRVVPFFDMVFHDCITIYGKYGYNPLDMAEQVIHHAGMGRTLYYHSVPEHLYWLEPGATAEAPRPTSPADPALYTRAHNGWAEGLCLWDRFMKNTHEILSPLARRTAQAWIERYEFLDAERLIRRTTFSNGFTVVVNGNQTHYSHHSAVFGEVILPPYGLCAEAGDFAAIVYLNPAEPALFTLTSLDGLPVPDAHHLRIYHGFGPSELTWHGKQNTIRGEMNLEV